MTDIVMCNNDVIMDYYYIFLNIITCVQNVDKNTTWQAQTRSVPACFHRDSSAPGRNPVQAQIQGTSEWQ